MNPANYREAVIEAGEDESEGADILLVCIPCFIPFSKHALIAKSSSSETLQNG